MKDFAILSGISSLLACVGLAQPAIEIQLSDTPAQVFQALELKDGKLAVSFRGDLTDYSHAIGIFSANGKLIKWMIPKSAGETGERNIKFLGGMAQHPDSKIWVADADQFRLLQFAANGALLGSTLLKSPSLSAHWLDFSADGRFVYLGGCLPKDRGAYLGCRGLLHRRSVLAPTKTDSFLDSQRQAGWNQSESGHYRLSHESLATVPSESGEIVAYSNLSARKIWLVNPQTGVDREIALDLYMPQLPKMPTWKEAQQAYLGQPILTQLIALKSFLYAFIRNQSTNRVALLEISSEGTVQRTWKSGSLPGLLVGRKGNDRLIFAFGNRLRCLKPSEIGKSKW